MANTANTVNATSTANTAATAVIANKANIENTAQKFNTVKTIIKIRNRANIYYIDQLNGMALWQSGLYLVIKKGGAWPRVVNKWKQELVCSTVPLVNIIFSQQQKNLKCRSSKVAL